MTSAIVRNQVANSTIDSIIKNRKALREQIMDEMQAVVTGWGVHLSTVEVCDVRILSGGLFQDMQSKFREINNKKATLERMVVENSIYFDKLEKNVERNKRNLDSNLIALKAQNAEDLKQARREVEQFKKNCLLTERSEERKSEDLLRDRKHKLTLQLKVIEREIAAHVANIDQECTKEKSKQDLQKQELDVQRELLLEQLKNKKIEAENSRSIKQSEYDLLKEGFKDPVVTKLKHMEVVRDLYQSIQFVNFNYHHMDKDDIVAHTMSTFSKMSEMSDPDLKE